MRILVLGAEGMLGRAVVALLRREGRAEVIAARRPGGRADGVDFEVPFHQDALGRWLSEIGPLDLAVNCVAVLARDISPDDPCSAARAAHVNAWFPNALALACAQARCRLIHLSTDAVFSPMRGEVHERDATDPVDAYGLSKRLGEPVADGALTLRLSIIGFNPRRGTGLLEHALTEWRERRPCSASQTLLWSGATVFQAASTVARLSQSDLFRQVRSHTAVLHFAPNPPITKAALLRTVAQVLSTGGQVVETDGPPTGRLLVNHPELAQFVPRERKSWPELIAELAEFERQMPPVEPIPR